MNSNLAYQDEPWEELIGGELFAMSPRPSVNHNRVAGNLFRLFANHLQGRVCEPFADGTDLYLTETDHFIPDMMIVCDPEKIRTDGVHGAPDLVVEVLSPGTAKRDRGHKKDVYAQCGVREYWIVSPAEKSVEIYRLSPQGTLDLHDIHTLRADWELERMSEDERAAATAPFQCCLYDDLDIALEDVFYRTF